MIWFISGPLQKKSASIQAFLTRFFIQVGISEVELWLWMFGFCPAAVPLNIVL